MKYLKKPVDYNLHYLILGTLISLVLAFSFLINFQRATDYAPSFVSRISYSIFEGLMMSTVTSGMLAQGVLGEIGSYIAMAIQGVSIVILPLIAGYLGYKKRIVGMILTISTGFIPFLLMLKFVVMAEPLSPSGEGMALLMFLVSGIQLIGLIIAYTVAGFSYHNLRKKTRRTET